MQNLITDRLQLKLLKKDDNVFILELVNTKGWLTYIGDRKVHNKTEAQNYIQKIITDENITYWVVYKNEIKIGIITLIKRAHLPFYDIGFAFLPKYQGNGYAYEASNAVLELIIETSNYQAILATTNSKNQNSIRLIEKLGFSFYEKTLNYDKESNLYSLNLDKVKIDRLIKKFFDAFTNKKTEQKLHLLHENCIEQTTIINNTKGLCEVFDLQSFILPREKLLTNGTLQNFIEYEIEEKTIITNNIAQRISQYQKEGVLNSQKFSEKGTKMFQLVKTKTEWKICNVIWDDEQLSTTKHKING